MEQDSPVIYIPHGGGPLPLMGDPKHLKLIQLLTDLPSSLRRPSSIVVFSAHWEGDLVQITGSAKPPMVYDYGGFPPETYQIQYPAPGNPGLAKQIQGLLEASHIDSKIDVDRGFDHGAFVPLKLMYPQADIPCVQLSLLSNMNPKDHIQIGEALAPLLSQNILFLGSGYSFHNMAALSQSGDSQEDPQNLAFENWLIETCTSQALSNAQREERLIHWDTAPAARYCHPREEHLLPLHLCYGLKSSAAKLIFSDLVFGKQVSGFLW